MRGIRDADVVEHAREFPRRNFLRMAVRPVPEPLGLLDARSGAGADVQQELARVHRWKKILAQRWVSSHEAAQKTRKTDGKRPAMREQLASSSR